MHSIGSRIFLPPHIIHPLQIIIMTDKKLIINADDFGLSEGINRAIIETHTAGAVTSASLMVNMPAYEHALDYIKSHPRLGVGVHLNVLRGKAMRSEQLLGGRLVDSDGCFSVGIISLMVNLRDDLLKQIELEYRAQIEQALSDGIDVTHLDSEKHHHMIPRIFRIVCRLAEEYNINHIRHAAQDFKGHGILLTRQLLKNILLNTWSLYNRKALNMYDIKHNDYFYGVHETGKYNRNTIVNIINSLRAGVSEIMMHPGYPCECDRNLIGRSFIDKCRRGELEVLLNSVSDIKLACKRNDVQMINYKQL